MCIPGQISFKSQLLALVLSVEASGWTLGKPGVLAGQSFCCRVWDVPCAVTLFQMGKPWATK